MTKVKLYENPVDLKALALSLIGILPILADLWQTLLPAAQEFVINVPLQAQDQRERRSLYINHVLDVKAKELFENNKSTTFTIKN